MFLNKITQHTDSIGNASATFWKSCNLRKAYSMPQGVRATVPPPIIFNNESYLVGKMNGSFILPAQYLVLSNFY